MERSKPNFKNKNIKYTEDGMYKYIILNNGKKIIVPRNERIYKNKDSLYKPETKIKINFNKMNSYITNKTR